MESDPQQSQAESLKKSNKNLKIALGGTLAIILVLAGVLIGSNAAKNDDNTNATAPPETAVAVPSAPGEGTPSFTEVDPLSLTNEQILESYAVDPNMIVAKPLEHTEEILSTHGSTPARMNVEEYSAIVHNPEAMNGFMPGYKDGGNVIEGHPIAQYGTNLTAYANLLIANLDETNETMTYDLFKYGARDLVAGTRQSLEKGGIADPLK